MASIDWVVLLDELMTIFGLGFIPGYFIGVCLTLEAWTQEDERREKEEQTDADE